MQRAYPKVQCKVKVGTWVRMEIRDSMFDKEIGWMRCLLLRC